MTAALEASAQEALHGNDGPRPEGDCPAADCPADSTDSWPRAGARALLCKLEKFPRFNGQVVELARWDPEKERWKCLLANGGDVNVRVEHLAPPPELLERRAAELLVHGRAYEARLALAALAGQPPAGEAPLGPPRRGGPRAELVEGRLELVDIPGKGKGYRAAKPISRGDVLLFDTALCSDVVGPSSNVEMARQCRQRKDEAFLTEVLSLEAGGPSEGQQRLVSVLGNNVFECSRETGRVALFTAAARFNHSCCPSAYVDSTRAECVVRALRDISAGEEVCVSYVPVSDSFTRRQESLRGRGIECTCERCRAEAEQDPQLAVPCQCGKDSFSVQEGTKMYQTCEHCLSSFDREESLHHLSKISEMNGYLGTPAAAQADPLDLVKKLTALEGLVATGAVNGAPPVHTASMFLFNNLANLHYHNATKVPGPHASTSLDAFHRYKRRAIEVFELKHSSWTGQRDVDYFQILHGLLACGDLLPDYRNDWSKRLADACALCYGQPEVPAGLRAAARR